MGSSLTSVLSPALANFFHEHYPSSSAPVAGPLMIGAMLMVFSLVCAIVLGYIDRSSQQKAKINHQSRLITRRSARINTHSALSSLSVVNKEHFALKDICVLPSTFWLIVVIAMLSQALFVPFLDNANQYFVQVFSVDAQTAGLYLILPYCVSSLLVAPLGYFVEKAPRRSYILIMACGFYFLTYCFMLFFQTSQILKNVMILRWIPTMLLGICISLFCAVIVPTIPMLVKPKLYGTAFGFMEMLQNLALGAFPLIAGALRKTKTQKALGFHFQTLFFYIVSCLCLSASLLLKALDLHTGNKLDVKDFRKKFISTMQHSLHNAQPETNQTP